MRSGENDVKCASARLDWCWKCPQPADCLAFCPLVAHSHLLLCGTYHLDRHDDSHSSTRHGSISLLDVRTRTQLQQLQTPAVLDIAWTVCDDTTALAAAAFSDGSVRLFRLRDHRDIEDGHINGEASTWMLCCVGKWQCCSADRADTDAAAVVMILSLAWSSDGRHLLVTDSRGRAHLLMLAHVAAELLQDEHICLQTIWSAQCNDHEAWTCAFSSQHGHDVVYTAGDDCTLRAFDTRQASGGQLWCRRPHQSGVTCLLAARSGSGLVSGGYDGAVMSWDERNWRTPLCVVNTGGGIWRLKRSTNWHQSRQTDNNLLLAACMHAGACVIDMEGSRIVSSFGTPPHESMVYGADWVHEVSGEDAAEQAHVASLATCSFYDQRLCLWTLGD